MSDQIPVKRPRIETPVGTRSRVKASLAAATDVNAIMRKYKASGILAHVNAKMPRYGDFTNAVDFHQAMTQVKRAQELFDALPSEIRNKCKNDPGQLLDMVYNPEREEEVRALGLIPPKEIAPDDPKNQEPEPDK